MDKVKVVKLKGWGVGHHGLNGRWLMWMSGGKHKGKEDEWKRRMALVCFGLLLVFGYFGVGCGEGERRELRETWENSNFNLLESVRYNLDTL